MSPIKAIEDNTDHANTPIVTPSLICQASIQVKYLKRIAPTRIGTRQYPRTHRV